MNTIVINADDCGKSSVVNKAIRDCVESNLITSTTIMSNMDDFGGAIKLYEDYSGKISFGLHINLDEGEPILQNELLLENGYYKQSDGKVFLSVPNLKRPVSTDILGAIYKEMEAQLTKLLDNGVEVTHIDSHHHIHSSPFILPLVMRLSNKYGIHKVRGIRNYYPFSINKLLRYGWRLYAKILNPKCIMTDYFCSVNEYFNYNLGAQGSSIELMCHPGHPQSCYQDEVNKLKDFVSTYYNEVSFVSYHSI